MARTIQCVQCGVVLNLPEQASGRRLKCPKCGTRFVVGDANAGTAPKPVAPEEKGPDTTLLLIRNQASSTELPAMPRAEGDLRETFDLGSMTGEIDSGGKSGGGGRQAADALALFDEKPVSRKKTGAEARAKNRRCKTCGGLVPQGMSICQTCGLDQETGVRIDFEDDLVAPPPVRSQGLSLPLAIIGGLCGAMSAALAVVALVLWQQGQAGAQYFIPIAGFGVYASVQFLRSKSVKLMLLALSLGALVDIATLVAMPIYHAQADVPVDHRTEAGDDPDAEVEIIRPVTERLDTQRITIGFTLLFLYAVLSIYLLSPSVQKQFRHRPGDGL